MFKKVFSKMTGFYGNKTHSIASDIVSIENRIQEIKTTPFYIYFDPSLISKRVFIIVNDKDTGVYMTIGELGQCFFEYPEIQSFEQSNETKMTENDASNANLTSKNISESKPTEKDIPNDKITENISAIKTTVGGSKTASYSNLDSGHFSDSSKKSILDLSRLSLQTNFTNFDKSISMEEGIVKLTEMLISRTDTDVRKQESIDSQSDEDLLYDTLMNHYDKKDVKIQIKSHSDCEYTSQEYSYENKVSEIRKQNFLKRVFADNYLVKRRFNENFYEEQKPSRSSTKFAPDPQQTISDFIKSPEHEDF